MISSLQEALKKELDAAFYKRNRQFMDRTLDHKLVVKAKNIETHLKNDLKKIIDEVNKKSKTLKLKSGLPAAKRYQTGAKRGKIKYLSQKQQPPGVGSPDLFGGKIRRTAQSTKGALGDVIVPIDEKLLNIAAKYAFRKEFTPTNYKKKFKENLPTGTSTTDKFMSDFKRFLFIFKSSSIEIKFGGAEIGKPVGDMGLRLTKHRYVVDVTNMDLMRKAFSIMRKKYFKLLQEQKKMTHGDFVRLAQATGVGTGYTEKKAPSKTHGETRGGLLSGMDGRRATSVPVKDSKTGTIATVAVTGLARESDKIFGNMKKSYKPGKDAFSPGELDMVIEETEALLTRNYRLNHLREGAKNPSTKEYPLKRTLEIKLELDGPQKAMKKFDANGIREHLKHHDIELTKLIEKRLGRRIVDMPGSNSLIEDVELAGQVMVPLAFLTKSGKLDKRKVKTTKSGGLDLRFQANRKLLAQWKNESAGKRKDSGKFKINQKKKKTTKSIGAKIAANVAIGATKASKEKLSNVGQVVGKSPLALATLLNKALPAAVKSRMVTPALVNRTGRFAESAEVENVTVGPRGATVVEYTYMKDPYQTFEPGNAQGSTFRDPRRIIGGTVRELAQGMLTDRFIRTRRV